MGLIDLHHHVVYGVDDGPKTLQESLALLKMAERSGITHIVATSHASPAEWAFPKRAYLAHVGELREACRANGIGIQLYYGCEIFYSEVAIRQLQQRIIPTLAGTRYVLVEFEPSVRLDTICGAAQGFFSNGFRPVIAHCERYPALFRHLDTVEELKDDLGTSFQMNASTIIFDLPRKERKFRDAMLDRELVDFVATDAHSCEHRPPRLNEAYEWLSEHYDSAYAMELCCGNQAKILNLSI